MATDAAIIGDRSALVLFSGGQDSTTCLAWALSRYERVETIGGDFHVTSVPGDGTILSMTLSLDG